MTYLRTTCLILGFLLACANPSALVTEAEHAPSPPAVPDPGAPKTPVEPGRVGPKVVSSKASPAAPMVTTVKRAKLERDLQGITSLDDVVSIRPNLSLAGVDGVVITGIPKGSPVRSFGLRAGDVVHSINGQSLSNPMDLLGLADALEASSFEGVITRDGQRRTLRVQVR